MLDDLMNDYQEFIDEKLNDTNNILDGIKTLIGGDDGIIATLKSLDSSLTNTTKDQIDSILPMVVTEDKAQRIM
mgnify:FL=1